MAVSFLNRVRQNVTTTGTGTSITLGSVYSTSMLSMAEAGAVDATAYTYVLEEGSDFEVQVNQVYTVSGTSFARGTPAVSKIAGTAGTSKMNLGGSATIRVIVSASELLGYYNAANLSSGTLPSGRIGFAASSDFLLGTDTTKPLHSSAIWTAPSEVSLTDGISGTATFTNGSANVTITTSLAVNAPVHFTTTGTLPTNFAASTEYYVLTNSGTVLTVSATRGGSAISAGSAGSGTHTLVGRILIDYSLGINFVLNTIGGNRTLAKPFNGKAGQSGRLRFVQDGTGSRTLAVPASSGYGYFGTSAPTLLSTAASAEDDIYYDFVSATVANLIPQNARTAF